MSKFIDTVYIKVVQAGSAHQLDLLQRQSEELRNEKSQAVERKSLLCLTPNLNTQNSKA